MKNDNKYKNSKKTNFFLKKASLLKNIPLAMQFINISIDKIIFKIISIIFKICIKS
jgi:hypothetical protein